MHGCMYVDVSVCRHIFSRVCGHILTKLLLIENVSVRGFVFCSLKFSIYAGLIVY